MRDHVQERPDMLDLLDAMNNIRTAARAIILLASPSQTGFPNPEGDCISWGAGQITEIVDKHDPQQLVEPEAVVKGEANRQS